jgi:hypothetical protein
MILSILLIALSFTLISAGDVAKCALGTTNYGVCSAATLGSKPALCECAKTYATNSKTYCESAADSFLKYTTCKLQKESCDETGTTCDTLCGALFDAVPGAKAAFTTCATQAGSNLCACWTALQTTLSQYSSCQLTRETQLSACIRARLQCTTLTADTCKFNVSIPLDDLKNYWNQYHDQFQAALTTALGAVGTTVKQIVSNLEGAEWTWKFSVTYQDTETIQVVVDKVKAEFSKSVGLDISLITTNYKITTSAKRSSLAAQDADITLGTSNNTSGSVALSFLLAPFVILNAFLLFLFY